MGENDRKSGVVKFFSDEKGYGFLRIDGLDQDVFVHHRNILMSGRRQLEPGQQVTCRILHGDKGLSAMDVAVVVGASAACPTCGRAVAS